MSLAFWSHTSSPPISLFLQLLSAYYTSVVLFVGYVYIFPLSCLLRLFYCLKFPRILSRGIIRWARYFSTGITSKCLSAQNFLWFEINCRNVSGSLGKHEMYENKKYSRRLFQQFLRFSQTWTTYRNTAFIVRVLF